MLKSVHLLRFLAAAIVLVSHALLVIGIPKTVTIGDVGVDIFFVISGLVIGLSTRDDDSAWGFAVKRFVRVVPPYWTATLAMMLLLAYVGKPAPFEDVWHSFLLIPKFGTSWFPIVFPGWTLSYEMLFYAVFGLALALFHAKTSAICMVCFAVLAAVTVTTPAGLPLNTDLCLEFVFGLAISEWQKRVPARHRGLGALCIVAALVAFFLNRHGPGGSLRWGVPSLCLVVGVIQFEDATFLRTRICRLLGDASYSIYLFHIVIMLTVQQCTNRMGIALPVHPVAATIALVLIAIAGGVALDKLLIEPLTRWLRKLFVWQPRRRPGPGERLVASER